MSKITTLTVESLPTTTNLAGKVIAITGADSELGYALALGVAQQGAQTLLIVDKQKNITRQLYDEICRHHHPEPLLIEFNISKASDADFATLADSLASVYPQIHGLIHADHRGAPLQPVVNSSMQTWQAVLEQQLIKPMCLTRSLIPLLKHPEHASIIFTNWAAGRRGRAYWGALGASYAAIENLSETLCDELNNYNIAACSFDPGKLKTALRKQFYPAESTANLLNANDPTIINAYLYLLTESVVNISGKRFAL